MSVRARIGVVAAGGLVVAALFVITSPPAFAACHAFTVKAAPARAAEGTSVTVTVSRDGAVNPSNVDVSSVDETATAGEDFTAVHRTISFTTDTEQSFAVPITDDAVSEGDETFRLHLSNPGGCTINQNFVLGPDATVTIAANDTSATTAPPTSSAPSPTSRAPSTVATAPSATAAAAPAAAGTSSTSEASASASTSAGNPTSSTAVDRELAASDQSDGGSSGGVAVAATVAAVVVVAAGLAAWFVRRRRAGP